MLATETPSRNGVHPEESHRCRSSVTGSCSDLSQPRYSDDQPCRSPSGSTAKGSHFPGDIKGVSELQRLSLASSEVDLENGVSAFKVGVEKRERDCRICHLGLEVEDGGRDSGVPMELGCSCKGDLGAAHKQCAETWFKIKGDTTCEICGVTALNITDEQTNVANGGGATTITPSAAPAAPVILVETVWHGRRIMNFLFACMVFAFVISWLFHFKVL
ncbi:uncharacterized protein LOC107403747 [Ziziphus jujuba]|uniref:Uncharacterized protein LOC107403747 n=1 Tax=Ziziphus jujuba TaxID=326968 RepID=A0A6P3YV82_ZIZJJ|nr:uncharacterized protein LOC107403747 [Ziziphus jujuba]